MRALRPTGRGENGITDGRRNRRQGRLADAEKRRRTLLTTKDRKKKSFGFSLFVSFVRFVRVAVDSLLRDSTNTCTVSIQ